MVQELEAAKTSANLTVSRDCDWLLILAQGPPETEKRSGKMGTHYSKNKNVKARPKKVEQETRNANV